MPCWVFDLNRCMSTHGSRNGRNLLCVRVLQYRRTVPFRLFVARLTYRVPVAVLSSLRVAHTATRNTAQQQAVVVMRLPDGATVKNSFGCAASLADVVAWLHASDPSAGEVLED